MVKKKNKVKIKFKVRKSISRRIKVTGSGKLMRRRGFARHLKAGKSKRKIRRLSVAVPVRGRMRKKLKTVMGV